MEANEYENTVKFLQNGFIPPEISTSKARWNFKRKSPSFFLDADRLYKVIKISIFITYLIIRLLGALNTAAPITPIIQLILFSKLLRN